MDIQNLATSFRNASTPIQKAMVLERYHDLLPILRVYQPNSQFPLPRLEHFWREYKSSGMLELLVKTAASSGPITREHRFLNGNVLQWLHPTTQSGAGGCFLRDDIAQSFVMKNAPAILNRSMELCATKFEDPATTPAQHRMFTAFALSPLFIRCRDMSFKTTFNVEILFTLAFKLAFEDSVSFQGDGTTRDVDLLRCASSFFQLWGVEPVPTAPGREAVVNYGLDAICKRCLELLTDNRYDAELIRELGVHLVLRTAVSDGIIKSLFGEARLHRVVFRYSWSTVQVASRSAVRDDNFERAYCRMSSAVAMILSLSVGTDVCDDVLEDSMLRYGLLFLLGNGLILSCCGVSGVFWESLKLLENGLDGSSQVARIANIRAGVSTQWKWIDNNLESLSRASILEGYARETQNYAKALAAWRELGYRLGIRDPTSRAIRETEDLASHDGCRWIKCPLYGEEPGREMFVCGRCHSASYCSLSCQERDWKEGMHKKACRS